MPTSPNISASTSTTVTKLFPGKLVSTPGALAAMEALACQPTSLLMRHLSGDWGDIDAEDAAANDEALRCGLRLLSAYDIGPDTTIWVITEADRSATTFLLPEEY